MKVLKTIVLTVLAALTVFTPTAHAEEVLTATDATNALIEYANNLQDGTSSTLYDFNNDGKTDAVDATKALIEYANALQAGGVYTIDQNVLYKYIGESITDNFKFDWEEITSEITCIDGRETSKYSVNVTGKTNMEVVTEAWCGDTWIRFIDQCYIDENGNFFVEDRYVEGDENIIQQYNEYRNNR